MEHKLSVIQPKPYDEREKRTEYPRKLSHRDELCMTIDQALKQKPKDFNELIRILIAMGYEYKDGKQPAVRARGQERYIRFRSLGEGYSKNDLEEVLASNRKHTEKTYSRQVHKGRTRMAFLIGIQAKLQEGKGGGYERWAKVFNLKQMANDMNFIEAHHFKSYDELRDFVQKAVTTNDALLKSIKEDETRLQEIAVLKTHILNYSKAKDVFAGYRASGYSRQYFEEHRGILTLRKAAKQAFDEYKQEHGKDAAIPRIRDLNTEYAEVLVRKKKNYMEYRNAKSQIQEYLMAQKIVEIMMGEELQSEDEQQKRKQEQERKEI